MLVVLHLGSVFIWEQDRGRGLNEIGSNKRYIFQHSERDQVVCQGTIQDLDIRRTR